MREKAKEEYTRLITANINRESDTSAKALGKALGMILIELITIRMLLESAPQVPHNLDNKEND